MAQHNPDVKLALQSDWSPERVLPEKILYIFCQAPTKYQRRTVDYYASPTRSQAILDAITVLR